MVDFHTGQKVVARLRGKLFGAMLAQDVAWFDDRRVGDLLNRLSSDTTKLQAAATETVSLALRCVEINRRFGTSPPNFRIL